MATAAEVGSSLREVTTRCEGIISRTDEATDGRLDMRMWIQTQQTTCMGVNHWGVRGLRQLIMVGWIQG